MHDLSVGERQRIEIVRCLLQKPKLLIMDEPTSVLTPQEVERLFETLRRLAQGRLRHPLHQPQAGRDPRAVRARDDHAARARWSRIATRARRRREQLAELMIGTELKAARHRTTGADDKGPRLVVQDLSLRSDQQFGTDLKDISSAVKPAARSSASAGSPATGRPN